MHDIELQPHKADWWVISGDVRRGPYADLRFAWRVAFAARSPSQRIAVLNSDGKRVMYLRDSGEPVELAIDDAAAD